MDKVNSAITAYRRQAQSAFCIRNGQLFYARHCDCKIKDKDSSPFILPDHGNFPTYLFFFSFFVFLFSLRLFCGAFLLSFTPLLFSFITPSSLQSFYILVLPSYEKKGNDHPNFCLFCLCSLPTCCSQALY